MYTTYRTSVLRWNRYVYRVQYSILCKCQHSFTLQRNKTVHWLHNRWCRHIPDLCSFVTRHGQNLPTVGADADLLKHNLISYWCHSAAKYKRHVSVAKNQQIKHLTTIYKTHWQLSKQWHETFIHRSVVVSVQFYNSTNGVDGMFIKVNLLSSVCSQMTIKLQYFLQTGLLIDTLL